MLTPDFAKQEDLDRYEAFMGGLVELIVDKYDGSLKAEHGTGVNMAPYVEREWGERATELMWRVKQLADPEGVLAPGVVLNRDPGAHLRNLKTTPPIEESATTCVECGFCEPVCPSRDLTTTPRQRIVLRREMARQPVGSPVWQALEKEYEYEGLETCATDGSCQIACPVGIDTGALVKQLRQERHSGRAERSALRKARRWGLIEGASRVGLRLGGPLARLTKHGAGLPGAASTKLPATLHTGAAAVYVPSCTNRIFAGSPVESLVEVSARAGLPVWIPDDVAGHCCGVPFGSKGYTGAEEAMRTRTVAAIERWTDGGRLPLVIDASSCTQGLRDAGALDAIEWVQRLLPELDLKRRAGSVAVHPTCSARQLGLLHRLEEIMGAMADEVVVPAAATCCGFAGDRGMLHPELTAAATADEAAELAGRSFDAHVCGNRTCEIGLSEATGRPYESFIHLLDQLTS